MPNTGPDRNAGPTLIQQLSRIHGASHAHQRAIAVFAAAIAEADPTTLSATIDAARSLGATPDQLYEVVLQSYLFLGFPRMLIAAEALQQSGQALPREPLTFAPSGDEVAQWFDRGTALCRRVYGDTFQRLRERVEGMAPDVFRWMILEGYGKVLSRPGLEVVTRELCIVASLMIEDRPAQLYSHMRGALNVGASRELLREVIDDIGPAAVDGYQSACEILAQLEAA